ncbi:phosphatidylserine decarboxylase family protein [Desulforhopalus sp. IMCC35007]|uniref:phosphatidylserine decarboxylase family protein n=1 Tax=Desulforhopalus sp. IMCC35007 TaxID=2569543 RepID=UPI0010ADD5F4|nr:phosphatidylserine decarboxylase family protein [Desulforhopalus sp. IMCC35007]TKB09072.1 phosphatidylserine decarboxylase family protein [Desulforhopalus sp. IMCC35007]
MLTPKVPVAKEGYPFIWYCAFSTLVLCLLGFSLTAGIMFILTTFVLAFFRDPERFISPDPDALVCPADGKIISIEEVEDKKFTGQRVKKVCIFMNVFNVHVNRVPFSGNVVKIMYHPGKFYSADSDKAALENEYFATVFSAPHDRQIAVVQIAGLIARRIICWLEPGDSAIKGSRLGLIRFGSRVDMYLPLETELVVTTGQKVRAGETIIGRLQ